MSEKTSSIDVANKVAAYASGGVVLAAFAVDRLKPFGVEFNTDLPVLKQFVEHAGNIVVDGMLAGGVTYAANKIEKKAGNLTTAQRVLGVGAMGLAIGAGFNAIPDTQVGMDHVGKYIYHCEQPNPADNGPYCTVDSGDFVWGTIGAGVIATSMTQWRKPQADNGYTPKHAVSGAGEPPATIEQLPDTATVVSLPLEQQATHVFRADK